MDRIQEVKEEIKQNVKIKPKTPRVSGGQSVGLMPSDIVLESEELGIEVSVGWYRSQLKNKEVAYKLFELALDDLIR